jgi:two-component system KDP operon response regulator KdpE
VARGPKVLLVQQDASLLKTLSESLAGRGCAVAVATGGVKGLLEFMRESPDLVIVDVELDDMNGLQLLYEIRERAETPVVLITPNMAPILSAIDSVAVLRKPFSPQQLMEKIREAIAAKRRPTPV